MLTFPNFDPVAISIGPVNIHWYGIMYVIAFGGAWALALYRSKKIPGAWTAEQISDLVFYGALGAVIGGRIGSTLFYNFDQFLDNPIWIFQVWKGGMSFHGGLLGVLGAYWWYARKLKKPWWEVMDFIAPFAPFGLAVGRFGNFINGELWGKPTDVPWGMVFPGSPGSNEGIARHPSQLYEMALEGIVLFLRVVVVFVKAEATRRCRWPVWHWLWVLSVLYRILSRAGCAYRVSRIWLVYHGPIAVHSDDRIWSLSDGACLSHCESGHEQLIFGVDEHSSNLSQE